MRNNRKSDERDTRPHEFTAKDAVNTAFPIIATAALLSNILIHITVEGPTAAGQVTIPLLIICAGAVIANALWEHRSTLCRYRYMKISYPLGALLTSIAVAYPLSHLPYPAMTLLALMAGALGTVITRYAPAYMILIPHRPRPETTSNESHETTDSSR